MFDAWQLIGMGFAAGTGFHLAGWIIDMVLSRVHFAINGDDE